jgi:hypothetical protein
VLDIVDERIPRRVTYPAYLAEGCGQRALFERTSVKAPLVLVSKVNV